LSLNPQSPLILTITGRLEGVYGNYAEAQAILEHSLQIKPDLTDTIDLLKQLK